MSQSKRDIPIEDLRVEVRTFSLKYLDAVIAFADALPVNDLQFLPRDTKNPNNVENWLESIKNRSIMSFIALEGDKVVGASAIVRKLRGWSSHVAEIRIVVRDEMRDRGLGRRLLKHSFAEAVEAGAEKLVGQMTSEKKGAMAVFSSMGFEREAVLRNQVRDSGGKLHDLVIYSYHVSHPNDDGTALGYSEIY